MAIIIVLIYSMGMTEPTGVAPPSWREFSTMEKCLKEKEKIEKLFTPPQFVMAKCHELGRKV